MFLGLLELFSGGDRRKGVGEEGVVGERVVPASVIQAANRGIYMLAPL